jgi:hypothetical protein
MKVSVQGKLIIRVTRISAEQADIQAYLETPEGRIFHLGTPERHYALREGDSMQVDDVSVPVNVA